MCLNDQSDLYIFYFFLVIFLIDCNVANFSMQKCKWHSFCFQLITKKNLHYYVNCLNTNGAVLVDFFFFSSFKSIHAASARYVGMLLMFEGVVVVG